MKDIRSAFKNTNDTFLPFLQHHWAELLGILLGCELLDQWFKHLGHVTGSYGELNLPVLLGRLSVSLLLFVLITMMIPLRDLQDKGQLPAMSLWTFSLKHLKDLSLESLRSLGWVLLFLPLLIIPGLIKYIQYIFVPYVVLCSASYQEGQLDALAESQRLMKGLVTLGVILLLISLPLALWVGQLTEPLRISEAPVKWLLSLTGSSLFSFYFNLLLYQLYQVRVLTLTE